MPLTINWNDVITKVVATLIATAVSGVIVYLCSQRFREFVRPLLKRLVSAVRWLVRQWRFLTVVVAAGLLEAGVYLAYRDWWLVIFSVAHLTLVVLALWILGIRMHARYAHGNEAKDLQLAFHGTVGLPIDSEPSRMFHTASPCVLPVCFKSPERVEYTYVVIDTRVEDTGDEDNKRHIITKPRLRPQAISSVTVGRARWYQLTSRKPLDWIRFGDTPEVRTFFVVEAEIHPVKAWNKHTPVIIPSDRVSVYGLAITEQIGPSAWFVKVDDHEHTFNRDLGCHFVEFVLSGEQDHSLSFGYKQQGQWGIACAFFAF